MRLQQDTGVTYLFITHDIATVRAIADEVVVMHRGEVVGTEVRGARRRTPPIPTFPLLGARDGSRLADRLPPAAPTRAA
jgi:peptide/nickel transport system ATP-binding protein